MFFFSSLFLFLFPAEPTQPIVHSHISLGSTVGRQDLDQPPDGVHVPGKRDSDVVYAEVLDAVLVPRKAHDLDVVLMEHDAAALLVHLQRFLDDGVDVVP